MINNEEVCLIYLLTNLISGKIYIGQHWGTILEKRMGKNGEAYKSSPYIYNAIQKYGAKNFQYSVLASCKDQISADKLEDQFIELYNSRDHDVGYNIKGGGSVGKHAEETKKKIAETQKAQAALMTPEEKASKAAPISNWWLGKERGPHTEDRKDHISDFMKGWHAANEHPMTGKHHTEEAKAKIAAAGTGRIDSPETTIKRSLVRKTKPEKELAIIQAYQKGKSISGIRDEFETGNASIYRILKRNNINLKKHTIS